MKAGVRLAGYGARQAPATGVLDPLEISAVLLECDAARCLIFSFDLMIVGSELQRLIHQRLLGYGFAAEQIVLLASHTHSAPATDQACRRLGIADPELVSELAEAAENLVRRIMAQAPSDVELSVFQGELDHSIYRRRHWPLPTVGRTYGFRLGSMSMAPNPSGPRDEQVSVILVRRATDGHALSILWHYTCHPTAVVPTDVISADFPGVVRQALRRRFGEIPCIFVQGFCGDVRPNIESTRVVGLHDRIRSLARMAVSGPGFAPCSAEDWTDWSRSLANGVSNIAQSGTGRRLSPASLAVGSASIPLNRFFRGSTPDKMLTAQIVRIGEGLEIIALSAEVCVGWKAILDKAFPLHPGRIRLHAGYLGALFGYLPTRAQIPEGGYEVTGFQHLFGLSGAFEADAIGPAVVGCVEAAFSDLERNTQEAMTAPAAGVQGF